MTERFPNLPIRTQWIRGLILCIGFVLASKLVDLLAFLAIVIVEVVSVGIATQAIGPSGRPSEGFIVAIAASLFVVFVPVLTYRAIYQVLPRIIALVERSDEIASRGAAT